MSRKTRKIARREIAADQRYNSILISRFINKMMKQGKRSVAESIFYDAMNTIAERDSGREPLEVFMGAIDNIKPSFEVKSRRVGGANYQIPIEVSPERQEALAIRWLLTAARGRGEKTMSQRLANEVLDAAGGTGIAVKKREDTHRMAEANKAFAHYRW